MTEEAPVTVAPHLTVDSFTNFAARLGINAGSQISASGYSYSFLTRQRQMLDAAYRTSWLVGQAVDIPADDMTRAGAEITATLKPDEVERMNAAMMDLQLWQGMADAIRWARLYGGAIAVIMIDGQNPARPLDISRIAPGAFRGLLVLDRWMIQPSTELVSDMGPSFGKPMSYDLMSDSSTATPAMTIHHSRALRFEGIPLPYYQRGMEQGWGESVVERIYDRLVAYDSTSAGMAQLVYKAHLRTLSIEGLRDLIAAGDKLMEAVVKNLEFIRQMQTNEGLTIIDAKDTFEVHSYTFAGLADVAESQGMQLSGALEIPLVRLFGQSPGGLNSTGESDLRTYYDGILKRQETHLRRPTTVLYDVLCRSVLGREPPPGFGFKFRPLWQTTESERSEIANRLTQAIVGAQESGVVTTATAMRELRQSADVTGVWSNITDEEIEDAEDMPPLSEQAMQPGPGEGTEPSEPSDTPKPTRDRPLVLVE